MVVPAKAKPVELVPKAGLAAVPNVFAVVAAAAPKGKGGGVGLETGAEDAALAPKVNGFGAAATAAPAEEPKVDCAAGA